MGKVLTDKLFELRKDYKRNQIPSQLGGRYTVQEGDTFASIAQQLSLLGRRVTPYELIKYNYNIDPQRIRPGQVLVVPTVRGNVLAIAALSLVAHNLYLGVLIFQQPDSTFRKAFALGSNVFATTATICLGYHDNLKRCRRAIAYDVQRASAQHAPEQNTYLFLFNMCIGCPNVGAESLINPDAQSLWYWFSDGHALLQGILCILVCDLVAVWLFKSEKVLDLVGAVRDNYVYVTLFFLLRQVVFLFYRDPEEVLPP